MASAQITSFNITKTKFENALRNNKYSNQNNQDYSYFMKSLEWAGITSIKEAALFLAHILYIWLKCQTLRLNNVTLYIYYKSRKVLVLYVEA